MYCSNCGAQNSDGAIRCVNCNSVLIDTPGQPPVGPVPSNYPIAPPRTYGLAVAGLIIPLVMTFILPFLLAILLPALSQVKQEAIRQVCGANLKGLGTAMTVYMNDYEGRLPTENWCDLLIEEDDVSPRSLVCPGSDAVEGESAYAMNKYIAGMNRDDLPFSVVMLFETDIGLVDGPRDTPIHTRRSFEFFERSDASTLVHQNRFNQLGEEKDIV